MYLQTVGKLDVLFPFGGLVLALQRQMLVSGLLVGASSDVVQVVYLKDGVQDDLPALVEVFGVVDAEVDERAAEEQVLEGELSTR